MIGWVGEFVFDNVCELIYFFLKTLNFLLKSNQEIWRYRYGEAQVGYIGKKAFHMFTIT